MSSHSNTSVRTLIVTTDHLFAIEQGLERRVNECEQEVTRRGDNDPDGTMYWRDQLENAYWRDQLENAEQALKLVQEAC